MMVPASIRNRNPGAQEPGPSSKKFGSSTYEVLKWTYKGKPATNKIATFPTSQHGAAAMIDLLSRKYTGKTIEKAISTWCGGYYADAYAKALEANGGVKAGDQLTVDLLKKPEFAVALCKAMARVEAGKDYPMTDEEWLAAHSMAFGSGAAPEFSPDNDVPSPGPNARLVAEIKDVATKAAIPVVGTAGAGGAVAVNQSAPAIPATPTAILESATAWKGFSGQVIEFGTFAVSNPKSIVVIVIAGAAMWFGPKLKPSWFGKE